MSEQTDESPPDVTKNRERGKLKMNLSSVQQGMAVGDVRLRGWTVTDCRDLAGDQICIEAEAQELRATFLFKQLQGAPRIQFQQVDYWIEGSAQEIGVKKLELVSDIAERFGLVYKEPKRDRRKWNIYMVRVAEQCRLQVAAVLHANLVLIHEEGMDGSLSYAFLVEMRHSPDELRALLPVWADISLIEEN